LQEHRLPRTEAPGDGGAASASDREKQIESALPRTQRDVGSQALGHRAGAANGPLVCQGDLHVSDPCNGVVDRELANRGDPLDRAANTLWDGHPEGDRPGLGHLSEHCPSLDPVAQRDERRERPAPVVVERLSLPSIAQQLAGPGEPAQHAVEDASEESRPELRPQRMTRSGDRVSRPDSARVGVHLDGGDVAVEGDHLARQPGLAHLDELEHPGSEVVDLDDGPVDTTNASGAHCHRISSSSSSNAIARSTSAGSV
jgi:hypothetical protein